MTEVTLDIYDAFDFKAENVIDLNAEPLLANVYSLSNTGNLTISFSKPIEIPPINVHNETES